MIKPKPWWLWFTGKEMWVAITPNIYCPKHLNSNDYPQVIAHEETHIRQQGSNYPRWIFWYTFSRKFRLAQEIEAIKVQMSVLPAERRQECAEFYARKLSGMQYLWCATYDEAMTAITS